MTSKRSPGTASSRSPRRACDPHAVEAGVEPDGPDRAPGDVDRGHGSAPAQRGADRDGARAGTAGRASGRRGRRGSARAAAASSQVSLRGVKTPGSRAMRIMAVRPYPLPQPVTLTAADLRAAFDAPEPLTVGLEEELMLLHPARSTCCRAAPRSSRRRPTSASRPSSRPRSSSSACRPRRACPTAVAGARRGPARPRRRRRRRSGGSRAAGVHPFAAPLGELSPGERYDEHRGASTARSRGASSCARSRSTSRSAAPSARSPSTTRCAPGCPSSRRWPPTRPIHDGRDTGMASIRPKLSELLPAPGRPAGHLLLGRRSRTRCAGARASGAMPVPRPVVVGAAPAPRLRHARGAGARRPGHGGRRGGGRRARPLPRRLAGRAPRRRRGAAGRRRRGGIGREPLVGGRARGSTRSWPTWRRAPRTPVREILAALLETLGAGRGGPGLRRAELARRRAR